MLRYSIGRKENTRKKIPTLFKRVYTDGRVTGITDEVNPGLEWVLAGEGQATVKIDGPDKTLRVEF